MTKRKPLTDDEKEALGELAPNPDDGSPLHALKVVVEMVALLAPGLMDSGGMRRARQIVAAHEPGVKQSWDHAQFEPLEPR